MKRRYFLRQTALGTAGILFAQRTFASRRKTLSPNEKLNIGVIGVAGRGADNLNEVSAENIVALCDVDERHLAAAAKKVPSAKTYRDFRHLIDQNDIDAILVATPDHTHAVAAVAALRSGRHLYCEKPLARTVSEVRIITDTARKEKAVTQLGTQIHAGSNYRRVCELVQGGTIGKVTQVHVWVNSSYGGRDRPTDTPPVPAYLDYDLWLGPIQFEPYHPDHLHFNWRHWWSFGGGSLADFGCHFMDLPHWALDLKHPQSVEIVDGPPVHPHSTPTWLIVRYRHPSRDDNPPVTLTWYHGGKRPDMLNSLLNKEQLDSWKSGVLFIGEKGMVMADYGRHMLLPEKQFQGFTPPERFIKDSIGHHKEWIEACKNGGKTTCNFEYSGPLTETALLGNVAYRSGCNLDWNWKKLRAANCKEAEQYVQHQYRKGWRI